MRINKFIGSPHIPVMLDEVVQSFKDINMGVIVDCTLGGGGMTSTLLDEKPDIQVIAIDKDEHALNLNSHLIEKYPNRLKLHKCNFSEGVSQILQSEKNIRGILADVGLSSIQLDNHQRGFSINSETLDMRMDTEAHLDALKILNGYGFYELCRIFKTGEIREYKKLSKMIVDGRNKGEINGRRLIEIIQKIAKDRHFATLVYQAIRIEVNNELRELDNMLSHCLKNSKKLSGAVVSVITFHSLEDAIVKKHFKEWSKECICDPWILRCNCGGNNSLGKAITKKPITPSKYELALNRRARSAKLRSFQFSNP